MKNCPKCGNKISENSNFCSSCGSKIEIEKSGVTKIEQPTISSNANDINNVGIKMTMKKPIIVVAVLLSIGIAFSFLDIASTREHSLGQFIGLGLEGLILYGLFKRHRLVWQWGRILAFFSIIFLTVAIVFLAFSTRGASMQALPGLFVSLFVTLIIFIAFGTTSAKEHFNLICPNCSGDKVKANDFLFKKAKCKKCNYIW